MFYFKTFNSLSGRDRTKKTHSEYDVCHEQHRSLGCSSVFRSFKFGRYNSSLRRKGSYNCVLIASSVSVIAVVIIGYYCYFYDGLGVVYREKRMFSVVRHYTGDPNGISRRNCLSFTRCDSPSLLLIFERRQNNRNGLAYKCVCVCVCM